MSRRARAAFFAEVRMAVSGGQVALVTGLGYRVELRGVDGAFLGVVERPVPPQPVSDALRSRERERLRATLLSRRARGGAAGFGVRNMTPEEIDEWAEGMIFPDSIPAIRRVAATPEGMLFVLPWGDDPSVQAPVDLFDGTGQYLGAFDVPFPDALGPRGLAAWVQEDSLGAQRVRVGSLALPGGAGPPVTR